MKYAVVIGCCLHIGTFVFAQGDTLHLDFTGTLSNEHKNIYSLEVNSYLETKLREISGEKKTIYSFKLAYNDVPMDVKTCKIRGHSTLYFKRKSFSISLYEPLIRDEREISKLALNSLCMDRHYYRNRLSFLLMERIGIFPLENDYAELRINGNSAGLYLAIQKPEDYIRSLHSPLLVRREYEGRYTIEFSKGEDTRSQMKRLRSVLKLTRKFEGQLLYDTLNSVVHLDHYFKWLAFNYIIKNGDYTDELFLYLTREEDRFDIIPWDYDDIFRSQPHDGAESRNRKLDHKLLYSAEAYLDIMIDRDEFLYLKFLHCFQQVLEILTPDVLRDAFEQIYVELYPYYSDQNLIAQSESDQYGLTSLCELKKDMQNRYRSTVFRMKRIETILESELIAIKE